MGVFSGPEIQNDGLILCVDAANPQSWSYNVHPKPIDIGSWWLSGNSCTVSRDLTFTGTTESPAGGVPLKMIVSGSDPHITTTNTYIAPAAVGQSWTISVYAKANANTTSELFILGLNSANTYVEAPSSTINVTTNWQRFSYTYTFTNGTVAGAAIRLDGPNSGLAVDGVTAPTIWWDGLQLEKNSSATDFNPKSNTNGSTVFDVSRNDYSCALSGLATHNRTEPKRFDTNATTSAQLSNVDTPTISFSDLSSYTLEFWVKLRSGADASFHSLTGQLTTHPWLAVFTNNTAGSSWYIRYRDSNATYNDFSAITDWNIQTNWTNITLTVNTARLCTLYVNGISRGSITLPTSAFVCECLAGGYSSGGTYHALQGSISLARFYNQTLTADRVRQLFISERSRFGV